MSLSTELKLVKLAGGNFGKMSFIEMIPHLIMHWNIAKPMGISRTESASPLLHLSTQRYSLIMSFPIAPFCPSVGRSDGWSVCLS